MGMTWAYSTAGQTAEEMIGVIHRAIDLGVTLIDTPTCTAVHNEVLVGRALADRRDESCWPQGRPAVPRRRVRPRRAERGHGHRRPARAHPRGPSTRAAPARGRPHRPLPAAPRRPGGPLADSWGTLAELVTAGKVRHLGLSEVTAVGAE